MGGMWVDINVEFRGRRDVTKLQGTAHDRDMFDAASNIRRFDQRHGDVGQRANRHQRDCARRLAAQYVNQRVDRMIRLQLQGWLGQIDTINSAFAMDIFSRLKRLHDRPAATRKHRHVGHPSQLDHLAGIQLGERQRHVAGHSRDRQHLQTVIGGKRQQDRDRIILAGIAINDDLLFLHAGQPSVSLNSMRRLGALLIGSMG